MVDASPRGGVQLRSLAGLVQHRYLTVRRAVVGAGRLLPPTDGVAVARFAQQQVGAPYATGALASMATASIIGGGQSGLNQRQQRAYYCSSLVVQAYAVAASLPIDVAPHHPCLPATLDQHTGFAPVPVRWNRVAAF